MLLLTALTVEKKSRDSIEEDTIGQSDNKLWVQHRRNRLTAYHFGTVGKRTARKAPGRLVDEIVSARDVRGAAIAWGKENQKKAIAQFAKVYGEMVRESGIFNDLERCYLGASPDGIVGGEGATVEVKCPYSLRFTTPRKDAEDKKPASFCLGIVNGKLQLKSKHNYMYQVEGGLATSGRPL